MLTHLSLRHLTLAVQLLVGVALLSVSWLSDEPGTDNSVIKANHQTIESMDSLSKPSGQC